MLVQVWYLPGVAERFGIGQKIPPPKDEHLLRYTIEDEGSLRRSLFEHTGGSYPEVRIACSVDSLHSFEAHTKSTIVDHERRYQTLPTSHW